MTTPNSKLIFGPVPSKRLGRSLGVDVLPKKTCNLDCLYCELGPTQNYIFERNFFDLTSQVKHELKTVLAEKELSFDVLTFTASGEPTLNSSLNDLIMLAKDLTDNPVTVLTNATLLYDPQVRQAISKADILLPSLDSVVPEHFKQINRPHSSVRLEAIIEGIARLRDEYHGAIWLEVLLVKGINDTEKDIEGLLDVLPRLSPDKVQFGTVSRPPAYAQAHPVSEEKLAFFCSVIGEKAEISMAFSPKGLSKEHISLQSLERRLIDMLARRPMTDQEIADILDMPVSVIANELDMLLKNDLIYKRQFNKKDFYFVRQKTTP